MKGELGEIIDRIEHNTNNDEAIELPTLSLDKVLADNNAPEIIDYLSLDVEGFENEVLINFPFDLYQFLYITIERPSVSLRQKLKNEGFLLVKEIPDLDCFYIHESLAEQYKQNSMLKEWNWFLFKINSLLKRLGC